MVQWYYAAGQQRHGPLPAEELAALFRGGRIHTDTWVWREGLAQWQPLSRVAAELGLTVSAPPPLPPAPQPMPAAAPKRGMSGCLIALIVVAACAVPMVAILAAIALPAYQDYTLRAKVAATLPAAVALQRQVAEFRARNPRCPHQDDPGFGAMQGQAQGHVARLAIGQFEGGHCGIEMRLQGVHKERIDGKAIWFEQDADSGEWHCTSEIDDRYLPQHCRG